MNQLKYKVVVTIDEPILSIDDIEADTHIINTLEWAGYKIESIDIQEA